MRTVVLPCVLLFSMLATMAQMPGGPLTITMASRHRHEHSAVASRGAAPYNDLCQNAVVNLLPADGSITITGDNTGATDTEDFGNPVCWEAFTIDTCATVTVSYCGTDPLFEVVYSILIVGCPDFIANVQNNGTTFCGDGNVIITYENLPAGTYYVPVLLMAGAEGPYSMTLASDVCDTPPLNDICANAALVAIAQDCTLGLVMGNNANAVINSTPSCATTQSQFQDVWYQFNSGPLAEVVITLAPGTIGDIGLEVRDACAGAPVFCAVGDTTYTVSVAPGTDYRVRVFSNNDFGFGGTFGICVTAPTSSCGAGGVALLGGGQSMTACTNGGDVIAFEHVDPGEGDQHFVLTDAEDTILLVLTGNAIDPATLEPGEYKLWGVAVHGEMTGAEPGQPLIGLLGSDCLDLSDGFVTITIEICAGLQGVETSDQGFTVTTTEDGPVGRWSGRERSISLDLFDMRGALLKRTWLTVRPGQGFRIVPTGAIAPGVYMVRVSGPGGPPLVRRVFVH